MAKKVKITKLPLGFAHGYNTYGEMCRPKCGARSRAQELAIRATNRLAQLMKNGPNADCLAKEEDPIIHEQQLEDLEFRNRLAEAPKIVQFAYWRGRLDELRKELSQLEKTKNEKKISLSSPVIKKQINEVESIMRELFDEIKKESKIISVERKK